MNELEKDNVSSKTIYLVPTGKKGDDDQDICKEYIKVDNEWELLGYVDLSAYATIDWSSEEFLHKSQVEDRNIEHLELYLNSTFNRYEDSTNYDAVNDKILVARSKENGEHSFSKINSKNIIESVVSDKYYRDVNDKDSTKAINSKALKGFINWVDLEVDIGNRTVKGEPGDHLSQWFKFVEQVDELQNKDIISVTPINWDYTNVFYPVVTIKYTDGKPYIILCDIIACGTASCFGTLGTLRVFYI
jgi:hypothetical protein